MPLGATLALVTLGAWRWRGDDPSAVSTDVLAYASLKGGEEGLHGRDGLGGAEWRWCGALPPQSAPARARALHAALCVLWAATLGALVLLLGGAGTQALGWAAYPPRGGFVDLALPGGAAQRVHAWCTGARNARVPTVWLDIGGGGHSMSDGCGARAWARARCTHRSVPRCAVRGRLWGGGMRGCVSRIEVRGAARLRCSYGLQFALNAAGRRVCTHDPPGTAWSPPLNAGSDAFYSDQGASALFTRALITAMSEPGPFIMVGTMDGGAARIYWCARVCVCMRVRAARVYVRVRVIVCARVRRITRRQVRPGLPGRCPRASAHAVRRGGVLQRAGAIMTK